jgi:spore coat protein U-like protein
VSRLPNLLFATAFLFLAGEAYAACAVSATGVDFGAYDVFDKASTDSTGTINITCDGVPPTDVTVSIEQSLHSGVYDPRQMKNTADASRLDYNLYTDAARRRIWGDGTGSTEAVTIKGTKQRRLTVYGSIPPGQNGTVGGYADTLTVTITP